MVFSHKGEAENSLFAKIDSLQFNMNFKISYVSLFQVVAEKLWINESRGQFFPHAGAAVNSVFIVIGSL